MKAKNTGEELIKVSYRLPKNILEKLEKIAIQDRRSINDELICLLEESIDEWRRKAAIEALKETIDGISSLQERIAEYAASRSISVDQASDELGITELVAKALADMEAYDKEHPRKAAGQ